MSVSLATSGLAAWTLCERELVRFLRQRNRVIGALLQPLIFWGLLGSGFRSSFQSEAAPGETYAVYFFPGILVLTVLFTAIFATISIIEDRREGFLQEVLIAPVPRWSLVLGKVAGGALLALIQAVVLMMVGLAIGVSFTWFGGMAAVVHLFVVGIALTSLGTCLAWRMESTQGFHAVMSVFLMPLWLLSGAVFPSQGAPAWLAWTIACNPVTYHVAALRRLLSLGNQAEIPPALPGLGISLLVTVASALVLFALAVRLARRSA